MAPRLGSTVDERRGVEYRELKAKDLLNRLNGRPMPFGWTINPYRGCEMACRYCFARYTHDFLGLNDPRAFERTIYVKGAERSRLIAAFRRARRSGQLVALGTATDPYQPAEAKFEVTRRVLEAAREVPGLSLSITTKSTLVARDAQLLRQVGAASEVTVNLSVTTTDPALARRLELRAPRPDLRFAAMRALADAGARFLQIDEPFLAGYPEQVELAIEAVNIVTEDVPVTWALHVCYGNRYARPSWEGHYDFLFPAVKAARVDQVVLEFARKGLDDLRLIRQHGWDKWLGLGVIDVKNPEVEAAELVASRIRRALEYVPADRLMINPDCGLRHLAPDVARQKLRAMVAGVALVRAELPGGQTS